MLEAEYCGFGASGRNGGWCSALFPRATAGRRPDGAGRALRRHRRRGRPGRRGRGHRLPLRQGRHGRRWPGRRPSCAGRGPVRPRASSTPAAARAIVRRVTACSAARTARTARPSTRRGWSAAWPRRSSGAASPIHEGTACVAASSPARWSPTAGRVRADVVVRALEGYTATLPGHRRALAPVYSLMIATEPLPAGGLGPDRAGAAGDVQRRAASDHLRPADRRRPAGVRRPRRAVPLRLPDPARLRPRAGGVRRAAPDADARCSASIRRSRTAGAGRSASRATGSRRSGLRDGLAWAGGYVGDGVAAANLAGRTLADLILGKDTERTGLPWVGHRSRRWEPEPLRWLGINAARRASALRDRWDIRHRR